MEQKFFLDRSPLSPSSSDTAAGTAQHSIVGTMRDVLLGLADDVSRGIVVEWLEPADVARLDIAYNNRELSRVLQSLLCSPLTLFDDSYSTSYAKLKWAMKRRLHLGSIRWCSSVSEEVGPPSSSRRAWTDSGCWTSLPLMI
jgi:hypothetical protein